MTKSAVDMRKIKQRILKRIESELREQPALLFGYEKDPTGGNYTKENHPGEWYQKDDTHYSKDT